MKSILAFVCLLLATTGLFAAGPNELIDPPTFSSSNGALDILITANAKTIALDTFAPAAWVYEVCYRSDATGNTCPADSRTASEYGGMRLQLNPGDHLKIRFINQLPPAPPDAEHAREMPEMLGANPTNLHSHGLIVEPRQATQSNPTYGDYVYVLAYPNGNLPTMQEPGLDYTDQPLDYDIYVPPNHPSGLFWIHPHVHGLALNQISYGLAGIITIGSVNSYARRFAASGLTGPWSPPAVRHLTLKDIEVLPDSSVLSQEDPDFCASDPDPSDPPRNGFCPGVDNTAEGGDYTGGKWFFSVNGQVFPTVTLAPGGEVWRITQASGSRSYELAINDDATGQPRPFQVLAIDGVSIESSTGPLALTKAAGGKFAAVACPSSISATLKPICATTLRMMPSSRIEIFVPPSSAGGSATLVTHSYATGPAGDDWPSANLAHIAFTAGPSSAKNGMTVKGSGGALTSNTGLLGAPVMIDGGNKSPGISLQSAPKLVAQLPPAQATVLKEHLASISAPADIPSAPCAGLPAGHHRRIFFGVPADNDDGFGLGYEEVDQHGNPLPGTFRDITEFDHSVIDVCLPLGRGNTAVNENWELVNVAGEDHNFHIHQTKFRLGGGAAVVGGAGLLVDNTPVPHGSDACDGTVATWRSGACQVRSVFVDIPFSEVGDFVYHCHILEHEDGGMMAHIRVVPY
jgi:L-ascorbate oxidase